MQSTEENTGATNASSKLMAVDDEVDTTFTLEMMLEQSGFSLDVFNDPIAAISSFKADYYDLILLQQDFKAMKLIRVSRIHINQNAVVIRLSYSTDTTYTCKKWDAWFYCDYTYRITSTF